MNYCKECGELSTLDENEEVCAFCVDEEFD